MITVLGNPRQCCDGLTRRETLKVGALSLLGGYFSDASLRAVPELKALQRRNSRLAAVVHRYLHDMGRAFDVVKECLDPNGCFVLVCGDNLLAGLRIRTWHALQRLLQERGFQLFDRFADPIGDRLLPPKRHGHKGLIKQEWVSAFRLLHPGTPRIRAHRPCDRTELLSD